MNGPDGLDDALADLAATARGGAPVLVALDFDGVLAPLVDVPSQSRATPDGVAALRRLGALEHIHLALVSGRGLADLASVAQVPDGTMLVGSHGAEVGTWDGGLRRGGQVLDEAQADLLAELSGRLRALVDGTAARVEVKPTTAVLHTRGVDPGTTARLTEAALALGGRPGVDAMRGRDIVELSVLHVTKGDALRELRARTRRRAGPVRRRRRHRRARDGRARARRRGRPGGRRRVRGALPGGGPGGDGSGAPPVRGPARPPRTGARAPARSGGDVAG